MRALDLFCGAGGASYGLWQAGFEVVGVDLNPQPRYPFRFIQADALSFDLSGFDFIWASPPCQFATELNNDKSKHLDLLTPIRERLIAQGTPWVIENVEGAAPVMRAPKLLCGSQFKLGVRALNARNELVWFQLQRHRLFEASFDWKPPRVKTCAHTQPVIGMYGTHVRCRSAKHGWRRGADFQGQDTRALATLAMGINWMTMAEMSEAIPPAYSKHIAREFLKARGVSC